MADETRTPTEFPEPVAFDYSTAACPRCGAAMNADEYRPCDACIDQLRASQRSDADASAGASDAFEPKMNVTPNAVALKDD